MVSELFARLRSLWRGMRRRPDVEHDMDQEFRAHMELRAADLVKEGVAPDEAARLARLEFGSTERYKDAARASRGLRRFDQLRVSWLDFKLGFRMLARYPGLTLIGGLAMAFAIWIGAGAFELGTQLISPRIPLPGGNRIVSLQVWDAIASRPEPHVLHDFVIWREELETVEDLGAYRALERNLITGEGRGEPVEVAEISASAFRLTRVPSLLGRTLLDSDQRPGAPPVVVIGYDVWQRRFDGDASIIGQTVRLANAQTTVVGVMPEGYAFPVAQSFWVPLKLDPLEHGRREGPALRVFGRLAPGASLDDARAELSAIGQRLASHFRDTHEHLRPQIGTHAQSILNVSGWRAIGVASVNLPLVLLVVLICGNVALLMFARAATRESEIVVRTALGAGRGRIIMQLFAEALVLGALATVVGLGAAGFGLRWVTGVIEAEMLDGARLPFWFDDRLSVPTLLYAALLTLLGAVIAGVFPALKVTRAIGARLKQASAGGGGTRFGGVWTFVIVAQVAVTTAFPVLALIVWSDAEKIRSVKVGFPAHEYLSARMEMDHDVPIGSPTPRRTVRDRVSRLGDSEGDQSDTSAAVFQARFRATYEELAGRLAADPMVAQVTFANRLPRMYHPHRLIELDEGPAAPRRPEWPGGYRVSDASVGPEYFDAVNARALLGRTFAVSEHEVDRGAPGTTEAMGGPVVVNESFVRLVMGGRNPVGRRLRYVYFEGTPRSQVGNEKGPWYEIVGVVRDLGMAVGADVGQRDGGDPKVAGLYHPVAPGGVYPAHVVVHLRSDPVPFAPRLQQIAAAVDPTLRLYQVARLDRVNEAELEFLELWFRLLLLVSVIALVLALAGIYSVMSFAVTRRTREIGVRVALGADRRRIVLAIFKRPIRQLAMGIIVGAAIVAFLLRATQGAFQAGRVAMLVAYTLCMAAVCLLACIVPTRRALRVQPTDALRAEE